MTIDDHLMILPPKHRIICRFYWRPIEIDGRMRWLEYVRVVQRMEAVDFYSNGDPYEWEWFDVGFFDELFPVKSPAWEEV